MVNRKPHLDLKKNKPYHYNSIGCECVCQKGKKDCAHMLVCVTVFCIQQDQDFSGQDPSLKPHVDFLMLCIMGYFLYTLIRFFNVDNKYSLLATDQ